MKGTSRASGEIGRAGKVLPCSKTKLDEQLSLCLVDKGE